MNLRKISVVLVLLVPFVGLVQGQLGKLDSKQDFGANSIEIGFEGPKDGALGGRIISEWGITFPEGDFGIPTIRTKMVLLFTNNLLTNAPLSGSSADKPLVINFASPAKKVGFILSNGDADTQVSITAFDELGGSLGSVQHSDLEEPTFVGVESTGAVGISKLLLSYGAREEAEEIDDLIVEYMNRPQFGTVLAQIADGPIPGFGTFQTTIIVTNSSSSTAQGELSLFDSNGDPVIIPLNGTLAREHDFSIPPYSSSTWVSSGTSNPVVVGYANVESNVPVSGTAVFRLTSPSGEIVAEAGVGSDRGKVDVVAAVQKVVEDGFDSGIAAVNVSDSQADSEVLLYDSAGQLVDINTTVLDLPAGEHTAKFLTDIFPQVAEEDFNGSIQVVSDLPLAVVIMRTANGVVVSSLPVGSLEK
jgi:hypothetical protein